MITQIQKRTQGISRVGRRLFPNLPVTGLPPAWFQLLDDPITALDRRLASVTSVPTPDSEENSTGTMLDSPPRHTFRQPQESLVPSQIAYHPAIASAPTPDSEENSTGTMLDSPLPNTFRQPQESLVSSQTAYDPAIAVIQRQGQGISRVGSRLFPDLGGTGLPSAWSQVPRDPITALDRRLASVTSVPTPDSEENSTGTMIDSPPPHTFRQPQPSLMSSQIAHDPAIAVIQRQGQGISRVGSRLLPDLGGTGLPPAWSQVPDDPITALDRLFASVTAHTPASETPTENARDETAAPPNFFATDTDTETFPLSASHRKSASSTALLPADISPGFRSSGARIVGPPKPNFAATGRSSSLPKDQSGNTKLVPFSRLAEMLHPRGPADESHIAPHSLEPTEAEQTAPAGSYPSSPAVTVEAVLEQLEQRLQFEFLRMYGSSGE